MIYYFDNLIQINKNKDRIVKYRRTNKYPINIIKSENGNFTLNKCYLSMDNFKLKIIHLIITRFSIELFPKNLLK